jgi:hypothetical protein
MLHSSDRRSILIAWELGGGLGHLVRIFPLVRRFLRRGHQVVLAVRDVARAGRIFAEHEVTCLQAPVKATGRENRVATPRSFAHVLQNNGYGDTDDLRSLAGAWRELIQAVRPDFLFCDHSPTALLAASGVGCRTATIGTGFCCPPDMSPFPDFRPWLPEADDQLRRDEDAVLGRVNRVLDAWSEPPLDRLARLYSRVNEPFLATFRELDHYPMRGATPYWGAWPNGGGEAPVWPEGGRGKRVFAYLKPFPALPALLNLLKRMELSTLVYCDGLSPALRSQYDSPTLRFAPQPVDLGEASRACDFAILNAGHGGTVSMLLAGTPILQVPLNLEQTHTAMATSRLNAGLAIEFNRPARFDEMLERMVSSDEFRDGAKRFATRYADFDPERQLDCIAATVDELLGKKTNYVKSNHASSRTRAPTSPQCANGEYRPARNDASRTLLIGIGADCCGTKLLAAVCAQQPSTVVGHEARPLLPWDPKLAPHSMRERFQALLDRDAEVARVGDAAHFYLPYVPEILDAFENVRVLCLKRDRNETIESYLRWIIERRKGASVNHWSQDREAFDDDEWDACFPKYPMRDLADAIGRFWDEYYDRANELAHRFRDRVRVISMMRAIHDQGGQREILDWIGVPCSQQRPANGGLNSERVMVPPGQSGRL